MCGRYLLTPSTQNLLRQYRAELLEPLEWQARYNVAPTQSAPVIVQDEPGSRFLRLMHWGLIPSWSKDDSYAGRTINCRSETASEKPSFREAFRSRRCLIPISGFYEWKREGKNKLPYLIQSKKTEVLTLAGLWEHWNVRDAEGQATGEIRDTFTLLTTPANPFIQGLHDRMPRILTPKEAEFWMNPNTPLSDLKELASKSYSGEDLEMFRVSRKLNSPLNEGPDLIRPIANSEGTGTQGKLPLILALVMLNSCALHPTRPCSEAGDVSWRTSLTPDGKILGDKHCVQKQGADGKYRNHGNYRVTHPNGKTALEGRFDEGKKEGFWSEFNEKGEKVAERYFEGGVEKSPPAKK